MSGARSQTPRWTRKQVRVGIAVGFAAVAVCGVAMTYVGWGTRHPSWAAPLEYPNRGKGDREDPAAFSEAAVCGSCHQTHYQEWLASGMGRSSEVSQFLIDLYELSLDVRGAPVEDVEQCLHCHAPVAVMGEPLDLELARKVSREGVNCDVCHTAKEAHANDAPGMIDWDPTGPKRGPLPGADDTAPTGVPKAVSPHHATAYSPLHESSELCGACHMSLWPTNALPIDWTYAEWARSPWADRGVTCQDCHMPTYEGIAAPGAPARPNLHRHTFPGGGDVELVRQAARIQVQADAHYAGHEVSVRVENTGAGHAFPTGNATAPVVKLVLHAFDAEGTQVFTDKREYRLIYLDSQGELTNDPTIAVRIGSDTTLQPLEPRHEHFFLHRGLGATRVEAELVYQRWSDDVVDNHAGLVTEFIGRYLEQGVQVHRLLARIPDIDYARLDRVRAFEPTVVDTAALELPPAPEVPAFLRD